MDDHPDNPTLDTPLPPLRAKIASRRIVLVTGAGNGLFSSIDK